VRESAEVAQVGFGGCDGVNILLSEFGARWQEVPGDRDVILACAVGERSLKATYFLMYQGYDRVANMKPGIGRWVERSFPITGSAENIAAFEAASSCCGGTSEVAPAGVSCCGEDAKDKTGACC